jgi:hypothetical protein
MQIKGKEAKRWRKECGKGMDATFVRVASTLRLKTRARSVVFGGKGDGATGKCAADPHSGWLLLIG